MTITAFPARNEYTATAGQTLFTYTFKIYASTDLNVYVTPSGQEANDATDIVTGYSVTGLGDEDGGTITIVAAASVGDLVTIVSDIPENRTTDYQDNGDFLPDTVNADFDRVVSLTKQEADRSGRTLAFQESLQDVSALTLPAPEALKYVRWKADLTGQENVDPVDADTIVQADFVERVENISELANLTIPYANKTYKVLGRTDAGDGGGGTFYWDSSDLSTEVTADIQSGFYVAPDSATTGANGAWVRQYDGYVHPDWFGYSATGTGSENSTALINMVAILPVIGMTKVWVSAGTYLHGDTVHVDRPVLFVCESPGEITTNANTTGKGVTFSWNGSAAGTMFVFSAQTSALMGAGTTTGELLVGGGIEGAVLDGDKVAARGVWAASTVECVFKVQVREFTNIGILVDGGNAALSVRNVFDVHVVYGSDSSTEDMVAISFRRFNGQASTQNTVLRCWGLVYDGYAVILGDTDNNLLQHVHIKANGSGGAINFNTGTTKDSRNNVVWYVNGNINAVNGTYGNRIFHHNSEASSISAGGTAQLHYDAIDYINAEVFKTHKYDMDGECVIDASAMREDGVVCTWQTTAAGSYAGLRFPSSADGIAYFNMTSKREWSDGEIIGLDIYSWDDDGVGGGDALWRVFMNIIRNDDFAVTPEIDKTVTQYYDAQWKYKKTSFTFINAVEFLREDSIIGRIERQPGNVLDTATSAITLFGIAIKYKSYGPDSAGSGPYDVTEPFV